MEMRQGVLDEMYSTYSVTFQIWKLLLSTEYAYSSRVVAGLPHPISCRDFGLKWRKIEQADFSEVA